MQAMLTVPTCQTSLLCPSRPAPYPSTPIPSPMIFSGGGSTSPKYLGLHDTQMLTRYLVLFGLDEAIACCFQAWWTNLHRQDLDTQCSKPSNNESSGLRARWYLERWAGESLKRAKSEGHQEVVVGRYIGIYM
ncbi:hypothetical protein MAPG_02714 [Magnaporthiopsis poae ATCC 64411]|uniref:Uncharacterized protein n=1 Tax=Magnaporthiopsis poae (strain ATCC 64411 / 73-15) TaxID=644358 RepID=A0A0C4DS39_MAGP6|nr:hypothetical protein MAPG_02714 [Magnaporthiopsis poae ATCC 64411]